MVLPLIPIALAGIGGGIAGGFISSVFGGTSKKEQVVGATEYHAPYETYQPTKVDARSISQVYSPSVMYQIESPGARITKKDVTTATSRAEAEAQPMFWQPTAGPTAEAGIAEGLDLTKIAVIGVIGLVAYGLVSK